MWCCKTFNFTTQITSRHLLHPCPWIKNLSAKTIKSIPKHWERSVKRKSNLNFIRVIKNSSFWSTFSIYIMVQTFLKTLWWRFLASRWECLIVSSATLLHKTWNISTLSMLVYTNNFFLRSVSLMPGLFSSLIKVLSVSKHTFFILEFHCFMLLINFVTSKYSFFRKIIYIWYQYFQICLVLGHFPCKHFLYCSDSAFSDYTEGSG